jgi:ABC-2 type transport system ATP-binding protein
MSEAIVCNALTRDFGGIRALDGLTLSVPAGAIFAFLGPNGAGKTTTMHLLLGIIEPSAGSASVLGLDPATQGDAVRRRSGALLEHAGLYERLSAADNLRFYARIAHLTREETDDRIATLLGRFDLYERRNDVVGTWSRGMKQKLAIARTLIAKPDLIFLDEPTAGLDPEATVALRKDIAALETTVFLTTHNLTDVEKMATHVAVIRDGQLIDYGTPRELRARAFRTRVIIRMTDREPLSLELADDERVAPIVTRLVNEGAQIEEVRKEEPSLEDVFLRLMHTRPLSPPAGRGWRTAPGEGSPRKPIFRDISTVMRKEWRELSGHASRASIGVAVALLAIVAALAAYLGAPLVHSPAVMATALIAFVIVQASIGDAFPGERERHTLPTLLASALPDEALLLGKILTSVVHGWLTTLTLLTTLLIGVNVTHPGTFYPPRTIVAALILTPLMLVCYSAAGVLVTMNAPTVRNAQPRLAALLFGSLVPLTFIRPFLSDAVRANALPVAIAVFAVLDVVVIALAAARFKRSRLV